MKLALVHFANNKHRKIQKISQGLARGVEKQGHSVDIFDGNKENNAKLSHYQYIIIGSEIPSLFKASVPHSISQYLKNAGLVSGKRSFAFILPRIFRADRALRNLMATMEAEGMFVRYSNILTDETVAEAIGKKLIVDS